MARIFISYSRVDEAFVRQLATSLSQLGADVWIDIEDIPVGMKWSRAIQEGLDVSDVLLVVISPESMASQNVEDEWQYYLDQKKPVIPLLFTPAKLHFQLSRMQYIDFHRRPYEKALRQLHAELARKGARLDPLPRLTTSTVTQPISRPQPISAPISREPARKFPLTWLVVGGAVLVIGVALGLILSNPDRFRSNPNPPTDDPAAQIFATPTPPDAFVPTPFPTLADLLPTPPDKGAVNVPAIDDFSNLPVYNSNGIYFNYPQGWLADAMTDGGETVFIVSNSQAAIDTWKNEGFGLSNAVGAGQAAIAILPNIGAALGLGDGYTAWEMTSILQQSLLESNVLFFGDTTQYILSNGWNAAYVLGSGDLYAVEIMVVETGNAGLVLIFGAAALDQVVALTTATSVIADSMQI